MKMRISKQKFLTHIRHHEIREFVDFLNRQNPRGYHMLWQKNKRLTPYDVDALRDEILNDLLPLIDLEIEQKLLPPVKKEMWAVQSQRYRIKKFLSKLNNIGFRWEWELLEHKDEKATSPHGSFRSNSAEKFSVERMIQFGGFQWPVGMKLGHDGSSRSRLYRFILQLFESGILDRFRSCRNCKKIFFQDRRSECCSPSCKRAYDRKNTAKRLRRREATRKEDERLVRIGKASQRFTEFLRLSRKKTLTGKEQLFFSPILKTLGRGNPLDGWRVVKAWWKNQKKGVLLAQFFHSLSPDQKAVFADPLDAS